MFLGILECRIQAHSIVVTDFKGFTPVLNKPARFSVFDRSVSEPPKTTLSILMPVAVQHQYKITIPTTGWRRRTIS